MQTKPLLYGLIGFFAGGLLVASVATLQKAPDKPITSSPQAMSMDAMTEALRPKTGDDYDAAFLQYMIEHHQAALDMAELSAANAKHEEIKTLSVEIMRAQEKEISQMKQWLQNWGYDKNLIGHPEH